MKESEDALIKLKQEYKLISESLCDTEEKFKSLEQQNKNYISRMKDLEVDYDDISSYKKTIEYQETRIACFEQQNEKLKKICDERTSSLQQLDDENAGLRITLKGLQKTIDDIENKKYYNLVTDQTISNDRT